MLLGSFVVLLSQYAGSNWLGSLHQHTLRLLGCESPLVPACLRWLGPPCLDLAAVCPIAAPHLTALLLLLLVVLQGEEG